MKKKVSIADVVNRETIKRVRRRIVQYSEQRALHRPLESNVSKLSASAPKKVAEEHKNSDFVKNGTDPSPGAELGDRRYAILEDFQGTEDRVGKCENQDEQQLEPTAVSFGWLKG